MLPTDNRVKLSISPVLKKESKRLNMPDNKKTLNQILGKRGVQKARRILQSEYQKYLIDCLKSGDRNAMQFEEWIKSLR